MLLTASAAALVLAACSGGAGDAPDGGATEGGATASETGASDATSEPSASESGASESATTDGASSEPSASESTSGASDEGTGEEVANLSFELLLASVSVDTANIDDDEEEFVRYCFTGDIQEVGDPGAFTLQGFDVATVLAAESVELLEEDTSCALVAFASGEDIVEYTIGVVGHDAVREVSGEGSIQGSAPLEGSSPSGAAGGTSGPDLTGATVDSTTDRVTFTFDEELDPESAGSLDAIGYYTSDGDVNVATEIISIEDSSVIAAFDAESGSQVDEAVRFFALGEAVTDRDGVASTAGAAGEATSAPDLVGIARVPDSDTQFDYTFDGEVVEGDAGAFVIYAQDGTAYPADSLTRPSAVVVRANFPDIEEFPAEIILATSGQGAATALDEGETPSTVGAATVGGGEQGDGALDSTSGPDLVGAALDATTGEATFTFDEEVDDDTDVDPGAFSVINESGDLTTASAFIEVRGTDVVVSFDESDVESGVGLTVNSEAVQDFEGNPNTVGTVASGG